MKNEDQPAKIVQPEIPTPLPLDNESTHNDKASDDSGTPEFKWGAGGANAKLPDVKETQINKN